MLPLGETSDINYSGPEVSRDVIVHSDRGATYASGAYQALLNQHQLICSLSRKGNVLTMRLLKFFSVR